METMRIYSVLYAAAGQDSRKRAVKQLYRKI
jgi:hypothetical protein